MMVCWEQHLTDSANSVAQAAGMKGFVDRKVRREQRVCTILLRLALVPGHEGGRR